MQITSLTNFPIINFLVVDDNRIQVICMKLGFKNLSALVTESLQVT